MTALKEYEARLKDHPSQWLTQRVNYVLDAADAAIESLKCCANCAHGCSSPYESVWDCDAGETIMGVSADDSCHFTPSCWQETK